MTLALLRSPPSPDATLNICQWLYIITWGWTENRMSESASVDMISPKINMSKIRGVVWTALASFFCQHCDLFPVFLLSPVKYSREDPTSASHESKNKQWHCLWLHWLRGSKCQHKKALKYAWKFSDLNPIQPDIFWTLDLLKNGLKIKCSQKSLIFDLWLSLGISVT